VDERGVKLIETNSSLFLLNVEV